MGLSQRDREQIVSFRGALDLIGKVCGNEVTLKMAFITEDGWARRYAKNFGLTLDEVDARCPYLLDQADQTIDVRDALDPASLERSDPMDAFGFPTKHENALFLLGGFPVMDYFGAIYFWELKQTTRFGGKIDYIGWPLLHRAVIEYSDVVPAVLRSLGLKGPC